MVNCKNMLDEYDPVLLSIYLYQACFMSNFKYFENHKSYVNEFMHDNTPRCQILI